MIYHNIVGQLSKDYAASCLLAYCFIFFLFSSLYFICYADGDEDDHFKSKKLQDFNFVVAGDFGCGDEAKKTITAMVNKKPELVLALGDMAYQKKPDCWFNITSPLYNNSKVKISIGEHDISPRNLAKYYQYIKHFNLTKPYYSFDYQNVHFLAMATAKNSLIPYNETSEQYEFVKQDLNKAHNNNNIDWIIVNSFRPFYSSNTTHPGLDKLQDIYHQLFEKYDVDIVLQAHNHNYQRTYPLTYNQTKHFTPIITDRHIDEYDRNVKGQIFFTVGTGGADLYNFAGKAPFIVKQLLYHGFLNVDVTDNGSKLTATFYENGVMTDMDHITITK